MNKTGSAAKVKLNSFDDLFGDGLVLEYNHRHEMLNKL